MRLLKFSSIVLLALLLIMAIQAQDTPLLVTSASLIDLDETILYSVILTTDTEALTELELTVSLPAGFSFVEEVIAPPELTVLAEENSLTWAIAEIPENTIFGPFTYRLAVDESVTEIPQSLPVTVTWTEGEVSLEASEELLEPMALEGSLLLDAAGTVDENGEAAALEIGETGVWLYLPAEAIASPTTLTIERLPVPTAEGNELSVVDAETWWCSVLAMSLDPALEFSKTAILAIPTRRVVTPALLGTAFSGSAETEWAVLDGLDVFIAPSGAATIVNGLLLQDGLQLALGVNNLTRTTSQINTSPIQDGTSNTVQSYVEQDNIIAILIGRR